MLPRLTARTVAQPLTVAQWTERLESWKKQREIANGEWADELDSRIQWAAREIAERQQVATQAPCGAWFITMGHAGFNSPANNAQGYVTKATALAAHRRYSSKRK